MNTSTRDPHPEQPYWVRQFFNFLRLSLFETLPEKATSWPAQPEVVVPPEAPAPEAPAPEAPPVAKVLGHFNNIDGWIAANYRKPFYLYEKTGQKLLYKGTPFPVDPKTRTHIACHITAIEFGVSSSRVKFWTKEIKAGKIPADILARYSLETVEKTAARLALHERFWQVPYHVIGLVNGDVLLNNKLTSYTYHGNYLNDEAIGLSAEADLPGLAKDYKKGKHTEVSSFFIETNRAAFRVAYELGLEQGMPLQGVRCHRQASNARLADPSEIYYKEVLRPMSESLGLTIDLNYKHPKGGAPVAVEWDERGIVDYRGKSLKR